MSIKKGNARVSHDVCFANMGLNYLAEKIGKFYDKGGKIASKGVINSPLLEKLSTLFGKPRKKNPSLGREGFEQHFRPILDQAVTLIQDKMCTICEFIAITISQHIPLDKVKSVKMLVTGGEAFNTQAQNTGHKAHIIVPHPAVVAFKEAVVFAFLGTLYIRGEINVLSRITGSKQNSGAGCITGRFYVKHYSDAP